MTTNSHASRGMPVVAALQVLINLRSDEQIVVTNQGSARIWPRLCQHPLDFHYNPSTMGGAIPLALGLALAQPARHVLVVSGEGSLLMSLGSLVTVAAAGAKNLSIVVLDNGRYEVTGGQKTPATHATVDWTALARGAGFLKVAPFRDLIAWQTQARSFLLEQGPRFISLEVQPVDAEILHGPTPGIREQVACLRSALGECSSVKLL